METLKSLLNNNENKNEFIHYTESIKTKNKTAD